MINVTSVLVNRQVLSFLVRLCSICLLRWRLFFWLFAESNLLSEFRLFVFVIFDDLLLNFKIFWLNKKCQNIWLFLNRKGQFSK